MNAIVLTLATGVFAFSAVTAARMQLSLFALDLGAQPAEVGILYAAQFAFPLLLSWPIGRWADRIGSRGLLMWGLVAGTVGMVLPWAYPNMIVLYAASLLSGLSFAFSSVLVLNLAGLLSTPETRARNFANVSMTGSTANVLGPLIAGFAIDHAGQQIASLCSAGLSVVALVLLAVWGSALPAASGSKGGGVAGKKSSLHERLSDRTSAGIILVSCLVQTASDLFSLYLPIYAYGLGISATTIGMIIASFFVAAFGVRLFIPQLIARVGEGRLLTISLYMGALSFALMPLFEHPFLLGVVAFAFGIGMGGGQPLTMILLFSRAPEGRSGETVALRQTANNVTRVIAPPLFGLIAAAAGLWGVFMVSAFVMGVGGWKTQGGKLDSRPRQPSDPSPPS